MRVGRILKYCYMYVRICVPEMSGSGEDTYIEENVLYEGWVTDIPFNLRLRSILSVVPSLDYADRPCLKIVVK